MQECLRASSAAYWTTLVTKPNVEICYWQYLHAEAGFDNAGWYCWARETSMTSNTQLSTWMKKHMLSKVLCILHSRSKTEVLHDVYIKDEKDAAFFALTFL